VPRSDVPSLNLVTFRRHSRTLAHMSFPPPPVLTRREPGCSDPTRDRRQNPVGSRLRHTSRPVQRWNGAIQLGRRQGSDHYYYYFLQARLPANRRARARPFLPRLRFLRGLRCEGSDRPPAPVPGLGASRGWWSPLRVPTRRLVHERALALPQRRRRPLSASGRPEAVARTRSLLSDHFTVKKPNIRPNVFTPRWWPCTRSSTAS